MEGTIGEIRLFAGNFAPKNWAFCNGQIIAIASNTALFSILGNMYGGNGTTNFALPNLASRTAIGAGQGQGLPDYPLALAVGSETVTLQVANLPSHTHTVSCNNTAGSGTLNSPGGAFPATGPVNRSTGAAINTRYSATTNGATMAPTMISSSGNTFPVSVLQPFLGLNYIICMYGVFPARN